MQRSEFDYDLPAELIAQHPLARRSASRLLYVDEKLRDGVINDLAEELVAGDLLVLNDTRVIAARMHGAKQTGGKVEILVERLLDPKTALVHLRASKTPRPESAVVVDGVRLIVEGREDDLFRLRLDDEVETFDVLLARVGEVPLPPYITHAPDAEDIERYQTVYARTPGAVAAPTAGLHFDEALLARIRARGVEIGYVTLHVGAGTFQPMREDDVSRHHMHSERFTVSPDLVAQVTATRARDGRVVAVGTTVVRALESAAANGELTPMTGETRLFIVPGYRFRVVDALLTNFHLPQSTLLMLVCAFAGYERVMAAYRHAVSRKYRFFSYGDAMWLPARIEGGSVR